MPESNVTRVLDTFARELALAIHEGGLQGAKVARKDILSGPEPADLQWYCGRSPADSEGHLFLGASQETWEAIGGTPEAVLGRCIERTLANFAEAKKLVAKTGNSEAPGSAWPRTPMEMSHGNVATLYCVFSPALEAAIENGSAEVTQPSSKIGMHAADLLSQVHVPVTVTFGGTQIRMKDLFNLATGSVVELDQSLSDSVEIRANNCLIARGEVVAIDGNYGVRVLELVSGGASGGKGILS